MTHAQPRDGWHHVARDLWDSVLSDWQLDSAQRFTLRAACDALDQAERATETIAAEGQTISTGRGMVRAHPACTVLRDSRVAYARLMRELALEAD